MGILNKNCYFVHIYLHKLQRFRLRLICSLLGFRIRYYQTVCLREVRRFTVQAIQCLCIRHISDLCDPQVLSNLSQSERHSLWHIMILFSFSNAYFLIIESKIKILICYSLVIQDIAVCLLVIFILARRLKVIVKFRFY